MEERWKKSSRSSGANTCVELGSSGAAIRDSKNPDGPRIEVSWQTLVAAMKRAH
ncbi:MAG: DUF397 domain-containing protein [Actinophytocola sp.]|uniref:DUF397 domain-containing protein n=1 Tax=Actinophytocola sp. TaxID=1872138 RepID=UPI003C779FFE